MENIFFVSDIGGTNSRFSIFSYKDNILGHIDSKWLKTSEYSSFEELLLAIKSDTWLSQFPKIDAITIAAAGAVDSSGECTPPNIPWSISENTIKSVFGINKVKLVNDFLAQSYAILTPISDNAINISGKISLKNKGTIGIIGPGTGLGKSILVLDYKIMGFPSEGGHSNFSSENLEESKFLEFVKSKHNVDYATEEHIICGSGVELLNEYIYKNFEEINVISMKLKKGDATLLSNTYSKYLGRVCRNFALNIYSTSGIVLSGGVLAKSPELINKEILLSEFVKSKSYKKLLESIPIMFLSNENSGLWGSAKIASQI